MMGRSGLTFWPVAPSLSAAPRSCYASARVAVLSVVLWLPVISPHYETLVERFLPSFRVRSYGRKIDM